MVKQDNIILLLNLTAYGCLREGVSYRKSAYVMKV